MRHTLTAVFENRGAAQHALNKLLAAGYTRADAVLAIAAPAADDDGDTASAGEHDTGTPVVHPSGRVPGARRGGHYAGFFRTGASTPYMLTLTTESEPETVRAAELVGRFIRTDGGTIDDRHIQGITPMMRAVYPPGTEPGALQNYAHGNSHYFGTRDSESTFPLGTTFQDPLFFATRWIHRENDPENIGVAEIRGLTSQDESDHVPPAIEGNQASHGYQDRIRQWKSAVAHRKANWTLGHVGELPPWERFKDALLHGWGRIKVGSGDTG